MKTFLMVCGFLAVVVAIVYVSDQSGADKVVVDHVDRAAMVAGDKAKGVGVEAANVGIEATRDALDVVDEKVNGIQGSLPDDFE